jgi:DNA-binding MarR family transcriptional regulator
MSLIESLTAGPNPELALFGQFVGDWDMDIGFYNEAGDTIYRGLGRWSFGWVLDGHAIQDVFSYPIGDGRGIGTTLRTYSRDRDEWQIVYLGAVSGVTAILHGGREGDNIVLRGTDEDGHNRWTFSDIHADSFTWTGEISPDGTTYHVNHLMTGTRRAPEATSGGGNGAAPEAPSFTPQMLGQAENALRALLTSFLADTNLTYHTWVLLNATATRGGEFDRGQLTAIAVNALKIDQGAVDAALATLAAADLVTTPPGLVRLTDAGSQLYLRLRDAMAPAIARLVQDHSAADLAATGRVLTALTDRANEVLAGRT